MTSARSAAVSPATVSNVLTGRRRVDPELASRVLAIVDLELGYRRDVAASALRSSQRTVVGAIVPELGNPFFAELVDRLEREARLERAPLSSPPAAAIRSRRCGRSRR